LSSNIIGYNWKGQGEGHWCY